MTLSLERAPWHLINTRDHAGCKTGDDCPLDVWREYIGRSDSYWSEVNLQLGRRVPTLPRLEYIGGGEIIHVMYEDRSYAWLGGQPEDDWDGPYAFDRPARVGGYRYQGDRHGEVYTERHMLAVDNPDDFDEVVEKLAQAARELFELPFTQTV